MKNIQKVSCHRQPTFVIAVRLKVWRPKIEKLKQIKLDYRE